MSKEFIEKKLYKGKITVKFFPESHVYMVDGTRPKSVTGIGNIKDKSGALVPWALEEAAKSLFSVLEGGKVINEESIIKAVFASENAKNKASDIGTEIHDWIEQYINYKLKKGEMPGMPEDPIIATGVNSFLEWESGHKVKFIWAEKMIYSKKYKYVGKADFAAKIDGELCLCDNKTSNGLYNGVRMQTAAYRHADEEESGVKYEGRWAIRIAKETEAEYFARMETKNRIKKILGKKLTTIEPYKIFDARFLDTDEEAYEKDFGAFLNCLELQAWDSANYTV